MKLAELIRELNSHTVGGVKLSRADAERLIEGRIIYPDDFEKGEIKFENLNFGDKNPTPLYHLLVSSYPKRTIDEVQPLLEEMLRRSRELQFGKGVADVKYDIFWTPENFQEEKRLPAFLSSEIKVRSRAYSVNPTKVRIGLQGQSHEVEASMTANILTLTAEGNYRKELEHLVETFHPQVAKLKLSQEDAQRLLKSVNRSQKNKYLVQSLEKALKPVEMMTLSIGLGGIGIGSQKVIEIIIPTKQLEYLRNTIGKPLLNTSEKEETRVTKLIKGYGPIDLLRGRRLSDLQSLARSIPKMDLGLVYGNPVITMGTAKELLEAETNLMTKGYESSFSLGFNSHMWRGGVVKRLARDLYGNEVVDRFEGTSVQEYVDFLKARGYIPPKSAEEVPDVDKAREILLETLKEGKSPQEYLTALKRDAGFNPFAHQPDYIVKELHLLEFFKQGYAQNPGPAIENFRRWYVNHEPTVDISATARHLDASRLKGLKLPPKSRLTSFGIREHMNKVTPYSNDLVISRTLPSSEDIHFWSRTSVDNPILLGLQEYACREMGIQFK